MENLQPGDAVQSSAAPNEPSRSPSRRATKWTIFAALVAFLPIPFVIPFFAMAIVPISYLLLLFINVGIVGFCYGLIATLIVYGISKGLCGLIYDSNTPSTRTGIVWALVLILFIASLFPIYKPGLDPPKPNVNIVGLFLHGIPVGQ